MPPPSDGCNSCRLTWRPHPSRPQGVCHCTPSDRTTHPHILVHMPFLSFSDDVGGFGRKEEDMHLWICGTVSLCDMVENRSLVCMRECRVEGVQGKERETHSHRKTVYVCVCVCVCVFIVCMCVHAYMCVGFVHVCVCRICTHPFIT